MIAVTYDQWKCTDPNDHGYYDEEDCCEHPDHEIDTLEGCAYCYRCGEHWPLSADEVESELRRQAEYEEEMDRERRREFWRKLTLPIRWPIFRLLERVWPRKSLSVLTDDEIPF